MNKQRGSLGWVAVLGTAFAALSNAIALTVRQEESVIGVNQFMVLPLAYLGKSSVEYLNEEDKAKPKSQQYKIFADMPLTVIPAERSESRNP